MSNRSRQAYRLGVHLSQLTGVEVTLVYGTGAIWHVNWHNGPLADQMREHVDAAPAVTNSPT
ncbi:hypothetical protein ACWGI8_41670 [Streptomyces sp. NPDC054841]